MVNFDRDHIDHFLGVLRKYMQIRGGVSQKELADAISVGVSTMSRFINQKTRDIDEQMIARMVSHLNIPLYEIIDFIHEDSTVAFKRLVHFYQGEAVAKPGDQSSTIFIDEETDGVTKTTTSTYGRRTEDRVNDKGDVGEASKPIKVQVGLPGKPKRAMEFGNRQTTQAPAEKTIKEKLSTLSPRQKVYLSDFLDLDMESRDLMVDLGNSLFRYFKQRGMEF